MRNTKILEALQMQPLSQEEMTARHILGRLYGPIATCVESTRNGRFYNKPLWEKALQDEIFLEKVATKALFLELGHPEDREETDMKQTCACIPEVPKIVGDDLYAYVDILDTPNGRLLKTLVDYGFVPGISSRGSGDVLENNQVDPETFFLETWDIVQLPAVRKARLNVCESLDSNSVKLKQALAESYKAAKDEDKDTMKKALENLNINIEEELLATEIDEAVNLNNKNVHKDVVFFANEIDTHFNKKYNIDIIDGYKIHIANEAKDLTAEINKIKNIAANNLEADNEKLSDGTYVYMLKQRTKSTITEAREEAPKKRLTAEDIPWAPDEEEVLVEEADEEEVVESEDVEASEEADEQEEPAAEDETETVEETTEDEVLAEKDNIDGELDTISDTVELFKEYEQEYGSDTKVEFKPVEIDGVEYTVDKIDTFVEEDEETEEKTLVIGVDCKASDDEVENTEEAADNDIDSELEDEEISEESSDEVEDDEDSAEDDGDVEVIESLKDMIRQKEALETEIGDLRKAKAVGDAKEQELQEKLNRYRQAFKQTSSEAAKVLDLETKVKELAEQLTQSKNTIKTLTEKVNNARQLKESADVNKVKVTRLNEEVTKLSKKSEALEAKLEGQTKQYVQKLQERTDLAKTYKARFIETLNKYVESKANMLGVQPSEITSRLNENYSLSDVDAVCDQILDTTINFSRLPFSGRTKTSARIAESVTRKTIVDPEYGYEIDDSLLELAGLKK